MRDRCSRAQAPASVSSSPASSPGMSGQTADPTNTRVRLGSGGVLGEGDGVAESGEPFGVVAGRPVGVKPREVVAPEFTIRLAVPQDVVGDDEDAVGDSDDGLLIAAPLDEAAVLGREVGVAFAYGAAGTLDQGLAQGAVGVPSTATQPLARALMVARAEAGPGGSLMRLSTSRGATARLLKFVGSTIAQHGPQDVHATAGEREERLMVPLSLPALACVEGAARGAGERAERRLVEDPLEALVAAKRAPQEADLARLPEHGSQPGGRGERVGVSEAIADAYLGDELRREDHPHAGQAADEGAVRVDGKHLGELGVDLPEPLAHGQRLAGEFPHQVRGDALPGQGDLLPLRGLERGRRDGLHVPRPTGPQVTRQSSTPRVANLRGRHVAGQQAEAALVCEVERAFQAGVNAAQEIVETGEAAGLLCDEIAAAADQQLQLGERLLLDCDRPQVPAAANLLGNHTGVAWIALRLAAGGSLPPP